MTTKATRLLPLPTGTRMEVVDDPSPASVPSTRPSIIFVHGGCHAAWAFRFFQPWFAARGFQTHAISLRGCGASTHATQTSPVTLEQSIADLLALFDAVSPERPVVLVAHSLGGFIAQKLLQTTDKPHRVAALVLVAGCTIRPRLPGGTESGNKDGPIRVVDFKTKTRALLRREVARNLGLCRLMFYSETSAPGFDDAIEGDTVLQEYMPRLDSDSLPFDGPSFDASIAPRDDDFSPPVLVAVGSLDVLQDRWRMEATARIWHGDTLWIEGAPHNLILYSGWRSVATQIFNWLSTRL